MDYEKEYYLLKKENERLRLLLSQFMDRDDSLLATSQDEESQVQARNDSQSDIYHSYSIDKDDIPHLSKGKQPSTSGYSSKSTLKSRAKSPPNTHSLELSQLSEVGDIFSQHTLEKDVMGDWFDNSSSLQASHSHLTSHQHASKTKRKTISPTAVISSTSILPLHQIDSTNNMHHTMHHNVPTKSKSSSTSSSTISTKSSSSTTNTTLKSISLSSSPEDQEDDDTDLDEEIDEEIDENSNETSNETSIFPPQKRTRRATHSPSSSTKEINTRKKPTTSSRRKKGI